jgi:hypothetical protein
MDLEGIVAKHRDGSYDPSAKWIKVKNPNYTQAEGRHELFESLRSACSAPLIVLMFPTTETFTISFFEM